MAAYSLSLFTRPAPDSPDREAVALDDLLGEVPAMEPAWSEDGTVFHTRDRCTRYLAIEPVNLRRSAVPPAGRVLCDFCRQITQRGRKG